MSWACLTGTSAIRGQTRSPSLSLRSSDAQHAVARSDSNLNGKKKEIGYEVTAKNHNGLDGLQPADTCAGNAAEHACGTQGVYEGRYPGCDRREAAEGRRRLECAHGTVPL